jgi:hypothetical protein
MATETLQFRTIETDMGAAHYAQIISQDGARSPEYRVLPSMPVTEYLDHRAPVVKLLAKNGSAWAFSVSVSGGYVAWKTIKTSKRFGLEQYRMRSVPGGYLGDYVKHYSRVINGKTYSFSRVKWNGGLGGVTIKLFQGQSTKVLREVWFPAK